MDSGALLFASVAAAAALLLAKRPSRAKRAASALAARTPIKQLPSSVTLSVANSRDGAGDAAPALKRLCVFCGSRSPPGPRGEAIMTEADKLGTMLVDRGMELVYGGGNVGVMGQVARAVDAAGGKVNGIIPTTLAPKEASGIPVQPYNATFVESMHDRKRFMASMSDAFVALPGGFGTFEELFEMITWTQLGIHRKTIGILNVDGFYDPLIQFINEAVESGFIGRESVDGVIVVETTAEAMLNRLATHVPKRGYFEWPADRDCT